MRLLRYLLWVTMSKRTAALPTLEKGQLWKTKTAHVEIMAIGKLLAQYRYFTGAQTRVTTTMTRVRLIQDHLKANGGKLVKNSRLKVSA